MRHLAYEVGCLTAPVISTRVDLPLPDWRTLLRLRTEGHCPQPVPGRNLTWTVICSVTQDGFWGSAITGFEGCLADVQPWMWWWDGTAIWAAVTTSFNTTPGTSASWSVPADWNSASNTVAAIGSGADGEGPNSRAGGGAGAFATTSNVTLTPSGTATYTIASGGTAPANTMFVNTSTLVAASGVTSTTLTGGAGGLSSNCFPTTGAFSGGNGGASTASTDPGGGGGGAGGPDGAGKNGGNGFAGTSGGGGGGGDRMVVLRLLVQLGWQAPVVLEEMATQAQAVVLVESPEQRILAPLEPLERVLVGVVVQLTQPAVEEMALQARRRGRKRVTVRPPVRAAAVAEAVNLQQIMAEMADSMAAAVALEVTQQALAPRASSLRPIRQAPARYFWPISHGTNGHRSSHNERRRASVNRPRARPDLAAGKCHRAIRLYSASANHH